MAIILRPYQQEAVSAVLGEWDKGNLSTMLAIATGGGKTECALGVLSEEFRRGRASRVLAIAHRKELIYQPRDRVIANWQDLLPVPGVVMGDEDECDTKFVVATIQTLKDKRLERALVFGAFSHLWVDEVHRVLAPSYINLIATLRAINPGLRILGTTATPRRTDGRGLKQIFDSVAYRVSIKDAIKMGALVPFVAMAVELPVDFSGVKQTRDGWDDEEAGKLLSLSNSEEIIIQTWKKHASERQTIAFTASVLQAHSLARAFQKEGVAVAAIDGKTKDDERARILDDYKTGVIQILVNCQVAIEGFDAPSTSCVLMARPTKSDLVYVQSMGRGLRLAPNKTDALILDFAPRNARNILLSRDILGKTKEQKKKEERAEKAGLILSCFGINSRGEGIDGDPDEIQMRVLDYLGSHHLAWTYDGGLATVSIAEKTSLVVVLPQKERLARADELRQAGKWRPEWEREYLRLAGYQVFAINGSRAIPLGCSPDWEGASTIATQYADHHAEDWCAKKQSHWRKSPATSGQEKYCRVLGVWRDGMTRGAAGQAITHAKALAALRAKGVLK